MNGRLANNLSIDDTKDDDQWEQKGNKITLYFNDRYAVYSGEFIEKELIIGAAKSKTGGKWRWIAKRIK